MNKFNQLYEADIFRYDKNIDSYRKKFHFYFRKCQTTKNRWILFYYRFRFKKLKEKHGIELFYKTNIGKGLYIGHPYNITINEDVIIGENCNIHKGVLIGQENRGIRKGAPKIGNNCWIGTNAVIVGKIYIGDDVLIAPNTFVNCDIPSHSIVFGNPCIVKHCEKATKNYINHVFIGECK